jgi:Leucine-rich repeat (LRR) protein
MAEAVPTAPAKLHVILAGTRQGDYRRRGLSEVPEPLPAGLRRLDLSHNDLAELRPLSVAPSLTELRLLDNLLTSVAVHRAGPLPPGLQLLDLSSNRLVALPPSVLQLSSLRMLQLGGQQLRALPRQLSQLSCLAQLEAQDNELEQALVLDAPGLPQLRRLNLCGNRLRNLSLCPDGAMPLLTDLDLSSNRIEAWPDALSCLPELRRLSLENNGLRAVGSSASLPNRRVWMPRSAVHQLTQLSELYLARNELSDLPPEMQQLTQLTSLDVRAVPCRATLRVHSRARKSCPMAMAAATQAGLADPALLFPLPNRYGRCSAARPHLGGPRALPLPPSKRYAVPTRTRPAPPPSVPP